MILIPAIDLKQGHCVRLRQGNMEDSTVFSDDPVAMAGKWGEQGRDKGSHARVTQGSRILTGAAFIIR